MGASEIPSTQFSTTSLPEREQFDAWHEAASVIFEVRGILQPRPSSFGATVDAFQLGGTVVTISAFDAQQYERSPRKIRHDHIDHYLISLYRAGGWRGAAGKVSLEGGAGDIQVLDLARSMMTEESASRIVSVFVPRETMNDLIDDNDKIHGIDLRQGAGPLLADYLELLARRLPHLPAEYGEIIGEATCEMIAACFRPSLRAVGRAQPTIEATLLHRAKRYINANLHQASLSPESVWREMRISRRRLYRLFERIGGVHHYIQGRRLSRIKASLSDDRDRRRIRDIAGQFGFSSSETFWRAFRRRYGVTPGDVRGNSRVDIAAPFALERSESFDDWIRHLHAHP